MNELNFSTNTDTRTLRGIWYSCIKPTLDKLGKLEESDQNEDSLKRWDAVLSSYVCDLLRKGLLTFEDLNISDTSRKKQNPFEYSYTVDRDVYGYKSNVAPYPNIIIATEKDTVYEIIKDIAELYGTSCISCKGQNSLGAMEGLIRGMFSRWRYDHEGHIDEIIILTMTDYDPAGYYIAEALESQVNDILKALGNHNTTVTTRRVGITPDQLTEEEVYENMYSPKKANIEKWMDRTGGIDGQEKGLELDAFTNQRIREIFVNNMKDLIDEGLYTGFIKNSYLRKKTLEAMKEKVEENVKAVIEEFKDDIVLIDFDIHKIGEEGNSLRVDDLVDDSYEKEIEEFVKNL